MESRTRPDLYRDFLEFVRKDMQTQRKTVSRRMFNVFLWCFLVPASASVVLLLLVRFGIFPKTVSRYIGWLVLIFPILYSLYVVSIEVLSEMPMVLRRGGIGSTLAQAQRDCDWRARTSGDLRTALHTGADNWRWILANFRVDLRMVNHRAKYLTGLAGAVFFLLMQGIDQLGDPDSEVLAYQSIQGFVEASTSNVSQFLGLLIFLVLLYLSGTQTYQSLTRYQDCLELVLIDLDRTDSTQA